MKTRGAVLLEVPGRYEVVELDVDDPRAGEIRVRMVATGLCHSDDHHATGDMKVGILPFAGGHEGAGIVDAVGPHTEGFAEGDHVVFSFLPSCASAAGAPSATRTSATSARRWAPTPGGRTRRASGCRG